MGDHRHRVATRHRAVEQQLTGGRSGTVEQHRAVVVGRVADRHLEQCAHDAEREMALERPRGGVQHATARVGRDPGRVLEQGGLAESRAGLDDDDAAVATGDPRHRVREHVDFDGAFDQRRRGWGDSRSGPNR